MPAKKQTAAKPAPKKAARKSPAKISPAASPASAPKKAAPAMEVELTTAVASEPMLAAASAADDAPTSAVALISRRAADRLRAGHLWVYQSDVVESLPSASGTIAPGELVSVADQRGMPLGTAISSTTSQIALRLISTTPQLSRAAYLANIRDRLLAAIAHRAPMLTDETNAVRLVFSEADNLPGIIADLYGPLVILQLLTQSTAQDDVRKVFTSTILEAIKLHPSLNAITTIIERPDPRIRELEQLPAPPEGPLWSSPHHAPATAATFSLNGLRFHYDADSGQKTGAFLDQRLNYAAAENLLRAHHTSQNLKASGRAGLRALDICTYQGGFALHLARVAHHVTAVDVSRSALEVAEQNFQLNRATLTASIDYIPANAFDILRDYEAAGESFDAIVLDPPAFAKTRRAAEGALRGYKELNLRALKMLPAGGHLITCSCSHHVPLDEFTSVVAAAASDAQRRVQLIEVRGAAPDHPAILTLPETSYLKCLLVRVLD